MALTENPPEDAPRAAVICAPGTNCDLEMTRAFRLAGAHAERVHIDRLIATPELIEQFDLLGFPGGFSYGDDIASGRVYAVKCRERLYPALRDAADCGVPMIGVCNGFQALAQMGMLPGPDGAPGRLPVWPLNQPPPPSVALTENAGARFIDEWVRVDAEDDSVCIWTRGLYDGESPASMLPLASGEGRFIARDDAELARLEERGQIALRYVDNVNGSQARVAGICDVSGRLFGLMPHPDRYLEWMLHPFWTRLDEAQTRGDTPGLRLFRNAVQQVLADRSRRTSGVSQQTQSGS